MRKVLLSIPTDMGRCKNVMEPLLASLQKDGCQIYTFYTGKEPVSPQFQCDIILAVFKEGLNAVRDYALDRWIPIFYFCSDITKDFVWNHPLIVKTVICDNTKSDLPNLIAKDETFLVFPFLFSEDYSFDQVDVPDFAHKEIRLLVMVDDLTLFSIFSGINRCQYYHVTVVCRDENLFQGIFNSRVTVVSNKNIEIERYIENTDIFLGNGWEAALAVSKAKTTLVVGNKGYGGIIDKKSINYQLSINFRGRLQGTINEYIPEELVFNDLDLCAAKIMDPTYRQSQKELAAYLANWNRDNIRTMVEELLDMPEREDLPLDHIPLIMTQKLMIKQISTSKYLIIDTTINKYLAVVTEEEYKIINLFYQEKTVSQILDMGEDYSKDMIMEFTKDLLNENILRLWI